jgi:hypothetical protein
MGSMTESVVEGAALEWLAGLGYAVHFGPNIAPRRARCQAPFSEAANCSGC